MSLKEIKEFFCKIFGGNLSQKQKIFFSASIGWIIFIGYLTWWNGLNNIGLDNSFKWDEWIWFGVVPALAPYLFYFIWKKPN